MKIEPLASVLRPHTLDEVIGQQHLVGHKAPLRKMLEAGHAHNAILFGPPGVGKTTLAEAIANTINMPYKQLNATTISVKDMRSSVKKGINTLLCIDECYRLTRNQQDVLLPYIENGDIIFLGCTTENPFHTMAGPLVSRSQIYELEPLNQKDLMHVILRALDYFNEIGLTVTIDEDAVKHLIVVSCGDARKMLGILELCVKTDTEVSLELLKAIAPSKFYKYSTDFHFDAASMFQGAIQASDADAAIWALAKWLESGEDPRYIARRLLVSAAEDAAGNPICTAVAHAAYEAARTIGRPECDIVLAQATILIARSPRDKTAAMAIWAAVKDVKYGLDVEIPREMRDCHYKGAKVLGNGKFQDGHAQDDYIGIKKTYVRSDQPK